MKSAERHRMLLGIIFIKIERNNKMKKFFEDFKKFAVKGNIIDMAVGVIIGGAFGKIVTSLVNDVIMHIVNHDAPFGGVGNSGIHVAIKFEVKEGAEILGRIILISCALINRYLAGFTVFRLITALHTFCTHFNIFHYKITPDRIISWRSY